VFFGPAGVVRAATQAAVTAATLDQIGDAVVAEARAFAGGRLTDDVCLLLARRTTVMAD
jgi:hypothetical protein